MLIAVVNVYNGVKTIRGVIERVLPYVDKVLVFDGVYGDFPHENNSIASTDGTLNIISDLTKKSDKVQLVPAKPYKDQIAKRSEMLKYGRPGDYYLPLDADHWVAHPEKLREPVRDRVDVGWFWTTSNLYPERYKTARIFRHIPGMHYAGRHHWIFAGDKSLITSDQNMGMKWKHKDYDITVYNMRQFHKEDRLENKNAYNRHRLGTEHTFNGELTVYGGQRLMPHKLRANRPNYRHTETLKHVENPTYTMICPFSRPWALGPWLKHFETVDIPANTELLLVVDARDPMFYSRVKRGLLRIADKFAGIRTAFTGQAAIQDKGSVRMRRDRILSHWRFFLNEIKSEYVLGAEDDTLPDADAYTKLVEIMHNEQADFVQGTELGRWEYPIIPHWKITTHGREIKRVETGNVNGKGIIEIDGGGWYLFAAKFDSLREAELSYSFKPPLGPDVNMIWSMKQRGKKCLGVHEIKATHFGTDFKLHPDTTKPEKMVWELINYAWTVRTEEQ